MALSSGQTFTLNNTISTGSAPGQSQYKVPAGGQVKILNTRVVNGQTYYDIQHIGGGTGWTPANQLEPAAQISAPAPAASNSNPAQVAQNPLQQVNQTIEDTFQKLQNEVIQKFGEYRAGKPFRVDEVLAEKTNEAKEQIDPYYNEKLGDYLLGVTRKINRGVDDTKDLLDELTSNTDNYTGRAKIALDQSIDQAEQGFADSGLFGSGQALATEGKLKYDSNNSISDYMARSDSQRKQVTTALSRNIEDINSAKTADVRDLERNRLTDVTTRAADLTKDAGQQYIQGFQGTLPPQLQASNGFDILKSLGIYS